MLFPSCQIVKIKWLDELAFILSFFLLLSITKFELSDKWLSSPTSFQGWQVLFSFIVFLLLLIHPRIRNEVKLLDKTSFILILPISVSHAVAASAGAIALSSLSIPIFLAWLNVHPAILTLFTRRTKTYSSSAILGFATVCSSAAIIFFIDSTETNRQFYIFLLIHVVINLAQSVYLRRISLQVTDFTRIFYNIVMSLIALLPVSIYYANDHIYELGYIAPCFAAGFFGLAVQIFMYRVKAKNNSFLTVQGVAQFFIILFSFYMFYDGRNPWIWCPIIANWFVTTFILNLSVEETAKNSQYILVVPQVSKNLYVEKYVNYNDMA